MIFQNLAASFGTTHLSVVGIRKVFHRNKKITICVFALNNVQVQKRGMWINETNETLSRCVFKNWSEKYSAFGNMIGVQ